LYKPCSVYVSCGVVEDVDHILFTCHIARYSWCTLRDCFAGTMIPRSREGFTDLFIVQGGSRSNKEFIPSLKLCLLFIDPSSRSIVAILYLKL
jgi:hypothetical protein